MLKKTSKKPLIITLVFVALIGVIAGFIVGSFADMKPSREITPSQAEQIVSDTLKTLPKSVSTGAKQVAQNSSVTVNDIKYGNEKNIILDCTYSTIDIASAVEEGKQDIMNSAYQKYAEGKQAGTMQNATKIRQSMAEELSALVDSANPISGKITLTLYEVKKGEFVLHLSDKAVDTCLGGILSVGDTIDTMTSVKYEGKVVDITNNNSIRTGIKDSFKLVNYETKKPEVGNFIVKWCSDFVDDFHRNFIEKDRWLYLVQGLGTTLAITGLAGVMGMVLGFLVAIIRCTNELTGKFKVVDKVCRVYLTLIRGTPVMVQLLIIYFVILLPIGIPKFVSAVLCFGLNSGAYVAEIVRGGIMSVDKGQTEAGRSLGFNYAQTMVNFVVPQAFKAVLPALANEFITLLKESSVAFYIGVADLTQGGLKIRSLTYSNFMPLIAVALIYLVIVLILTKLVSILERRLRKSDH